jgi:hypothetical protein
VYRQMKILIGVIAISCCVVSDNLARAQTTQILFQETDTGTARPLTTAEMEKLQDPLFKLVLGRRPDVTKLAEIEGLIQPDPSKRRIFVVDEEIKDPQQPQSRRAVMDFLGITDGLQLGGNVMLSVFFSSDDFPEATDIEAWGWDEPNGVYNFYKLDHSGNTGSSLSWKFRGSSAKADHLTVGERSGTCLRCHTSGVPVMKELAFPWNNWHSFTSRAEYLISQAAPAQRWPVAGNPRFSHLLGGDDLETTILGGITRFNNRRFEERVKPDGQGGLAVEDARTLLRPLFATTEINLASAQQPSGLHPLTPGAHNGPSQPIRVPDSFFLTDGILAGATRLVGLGISEARGFNSVAIIQPAEYKAMVEGADLKIRSSRLGTLAGDTHFAWFTPELGFAALQWIDTLIQRKVVSPAFAAAVLGVDLETPIFSEARASLLDSIPETFTTVPGEPHPDRLTREVIARLASENPAPGSAKAEFLALLKNPSPVEEVRGRVIAYRNRITQRLNDVNTRQTELDRLFRLLLERREKLVKDPMFGQLIESGALIPRP